MFFITWMTVKRLINGQAHISSSYAMARTAYPYTSAWPCISIRAAAILPSINLLTVIQMDCCNIIGNPSQNRMTVKRLTNGQAHISSSHAMAHAADPYTKPWPHRSIRAAAILPSINLITVIQTDCCNIISNLYLNWITVKRLTSGQAHISS